MYRGFNLKLDWYNPQCYESGKRLYDINKRIVASNLDVFLNDDNFLDGSLLESDWFPQFSADVFLSHSHIDQNKAIALSWWLHSKFGITTFIDSCIWSHADKLLKAVDNKYCLQGNGTYNYEKRNATTSHIHMMLNTALIKLIDKTECLMFLNTPNSILNSNLSSQTGSPWIYSEITITKLIRQAVPKRHIELREFNKGGEVVSPFKVKYEVDLSHLTDINASDLDKWADNSIAKKGSEQLDVLYKLFPANRSNILNG